jgi:hypothetical protein
MDPTVQCILGTEHSRMRNCPCHRWHRLEFGMPCASGESPTGRTASDTASLVRRNALARFEETATAYYQWINATDCRRLHAVCTRSRKRGWPSSSGSLHAVVPCG